MYLTEVGSLAQVIGLYHYDDDPGTWVLLTIITLCVSIAHVLTDSTGVLLSLVWVCWVLFALDKMCVRIKRVLPYGSTKRLLRRRSCLLRTETLVIQEQLREVLGRGGEEEETGIGSKTGTASHCRVPSLGVHPQRVEEGIGNEIIDGFFRRVCGVKIQTATILQRIEDHPQVIPREYNSQSVLQTSERVALPSRKLP